MAEKKVRKIEATAPLRTAQAFAPVKKRRVAAYARVSTDKDEQQNSYEAQVDYYTSHIQGNPEWIFAGVYSDDGIILGTSQEVLAPQGFPDLVLIFIWPEINGPYGRLIRKCVELSPSPIRRAA